MTSRTKSSYPFVRTSAEGLSVTGSPDFYINTRYVRFEGLLDEQLEVAASLVSDRSELEFHLQDLEFSTERVLWFRLSNWLRFLNENHHSIGGVQSQLILAVICAAKRSELFRLQTRHEFEISLEFLERLFSQKRFLKLGTLESANYLLSVSLVVGSYPGMLVGSINSAIDNLDGGGSLRSFQSFFCQLLVRYEPPHFLVDKLPKLTLKETRALMHVLQGNNIRTFPELPLSVSRKESWVLQNAFPRNIRFEEDVLLREIVCSKLLIGSKSGGRILQEFVENCKPFQFNLQTFINDFAFWKQAFNMCCEIDWDEVVMSMGVFLDHLEYRRYVHEDDFTLKGRSPRSLEDELFEWNERQSYEELKKLRHITWQGSGMEDWLFEHSDQEYCLSEIKNGQELFDESQNLKHCAYGYVKYCAEGHTSVWCLKRKEDSFYKSYITLEVQEKQITQASGMRNRCLTDEEEELLVLVREQLSLAKEQFGLEEEVVTDYLNEYEL